MKIIDTLTSWVGAKQGDATHKKIVDTYNSYTPLPRKYKLTYTDAWCAATVSAAAIACGLTDIIPVECSCAEQIKAYQKMGRWIEADDHVPEVGEQVFYDWQDGENYATTDNKGAPDHTGIVVSVSGTTFRVIEGNKGTAHVCDYRDMKVNGRYLRGFGSPAYKKEVAENMLLSKGSKGNAVKKLQTFLNSVGYSLDVDGSFGPKTQTAWNDYVLKYIKKTMSA